MEGLLADLLALLLRWLHLITGIAWIGASFYFVWLDNSLRPPPAHKDRDGIGGELWSFHGGGIYEVNRYRAGPPEMPAQLHWFYWEAYSTFLTGIALLTVVYYLRADTYLLGGPWLSEPWHAVTASVAFIVGGVACYEILLRTPIAGRLGLFMLCLVPVIALQCWLATRLFPGRAAFLHVGMLLGSAMVANVFIGIIPPQRAFVRAVERGSEPPVAGLARAKLRSVHNNYFTLPVLFCMISNHYPQLYGHELSWLLLLAIIVLSAWARHFFNLRHRGIRRPAILLGALSGFLLLAAALAWEQRLSARSEPSTAMPDSAGVATLVTTHCAVCHGMEPSWPGFSAPPQGLVLETPEDLRLSGSRSTAALASRYMPLGNVTGLGDRERDQLLSWLRGGTALD